MSISFFCCYDNRALCVLYWRERGAYFAEDRTPTHCQHLVHTVSCPGAWLAYLCSFARSALSRAVHLRIFYLRYGGSMSLHNWLSHFLSVGDIALWCVPSSRAAHCPRGLGFAIAAALTPSPSIITPSAPCVLFHSFSPAPLSASAFSRTRSFFRSLAIWRTGLGQTDSGSGRRSLPRSPRLRKKCI